MTNKGTLFVISAPSGCGKGTILSEVFKNYNNVFYSISATTRKPREGEKHGVNYYFMSKDEFTELINNCTMESAEQDGVLGVKVTGPNGNSIFLPLGGSWVRFIPPSYDFAGYYLSSSPYGDNLERATYMFVQDFGSITFYNLRHIGINVRPVSD